MQPVDVAIRDTEIKLGQFIKLASLVETGGAAKEVIANGEVTVNGEVDTRRGKTLRGGEIVCVGNLCARVVVGAAEEDYFDEATANDDFDPEQWRNV
ncbi:RNA-binding S4 domain-containing protein [Corynebacterium felinum]|uniref:Ribosome-associated protein n=1 Tax=Corynebacterium felinum TaxID=131318 RepID=A0ABU2B7U4_9CORY|nr:RNA-binding S4 domain-containing protein [Corynebacterium felinum]MDF5819777.1 RNA-binding S4 domain-containing protein [Corynebacterium felinum]MDR7354356.1 ribosome-associated protein [Corynebacterium felinum]WJY93728.1 ribosome-associated protein [Corynebacterium felinum]